MKLSCSALKNWLILLIPPILNSSTTHSSNQILIHSLNSPFSGSKYLHLPNSSFLIALIEQMNAVRFKHILSEGCFVALEVTTEQEGTLVMTPGGDVDPYCVVSCVVDRLSGYRDLEFIPAASLADIRRQVKHLARVFRRRS